MGKHLYISQRPDSVYVRVPNPKQRRKFICKAFTFSVLGRRRALGEALFWRDETYKSLYGELPSAPRRFRMAKTNSTTGILGVWISTRGKYRVVVASGPRGTRKAEFSIARYGLKGALKLAREASAAAYREARQSGEI